MICFVILHYMVIEETKKCVDSILKVEGDKKIIIVDNASTNNSGNILKEMYQNNENIEIIINENNLGFANGNNIGYKKALEYNPDYIAVLNNDIEITQTDFIKRIEKIYNEEKFAVLGPDIYSTTAKIHQSPKRLSSYTYDEVNKLFKEYEIKKNSKFLVPLRCFLKKIKVLKQIVFKNRERNLGIDYNKKYYNIPLHGSFVVFSKDFIKFRDYAFFKKTFMYFEMEILDYECNINNLKEVYDPSIKILHHHSASSNKTFGSELKKVRFMNDCIYDSLNACIELMNEKGRL